MSNATHVAPRLDFMYWYTQEAVYLNGQLMYYGNRTACWELLLALGYECNSSFTMPTQIPKEFDINPETGWWVPPKILATLAGQCGSYEWRTHLERIVFLENELAELKVRR